MLTEKGKLYGDLTVACISETHFMLFGSGAMQEPIDGGLKRTLLTLVSSTAMSPMTGMGLLCQGLIQRSAPMHNQGRCFSNALSFRDIRQTVVADIPVLLARISFPVNSVTKFMPASVPVAIGRSD